MPVAGVEGRRRCFLGDPAPEPGEQPVEHIRRLRALGSVIWRIRQFATFVTMSLMSLARTMRGFRVSSCTNRTFILGAASARSGGLTFA